MEGPFLRGGPRPIPAFCVSDPKISSIEVDSLRHRSTLAPCRLGVPNRNAGWCCSRVLPDRISEKHKCQRFKLVTYRQNWGEDRVYFYNAEGRLSSLPARWTTVPEEDPFVAMAGGRCFFRYEERAAPSEVTIRTPSTTAVGRFRAST